MKSMLVFCVFLVIGAVECARIRRQAAAEITPKTQGMDVASGFMSDELDKEKGLGGPVNPAGLEKASDMTDKISSGDSLNSLLSDAVKPPQYGAGAAKPDDTKVDLSGVAA